jgi:hypothetical protein
MRAAILHSPSTSSWRGAHLKHRDDFTFIRMNLPFRVSVCASSIIVDPLLLGLFTLAIFLYPSIISSLLGSTFTSVNNIRISTHGMHLESFCTLKHLKVFTIINCPLFTILTNISEFTNHILIGNTPLWPLITSPKNSLQGTQQYRD